MRAFHLAPDWSRWPVINDGRVNIAFIYGHWRIFSVHSGAEVHRLTADIISAIVHGTHIADTVPDHVAELCHVSREELRTHLLSFEDALRARWGEVYTVHELMPTVYFWLPPYEYGVPEWVLCKEDGVWCGNGTPVPQALAEVCESVCVVGGLA